jgi:hypothetical protein
MLSVYSFKGTLAVRRATRPPRSRAATVGTGAGTAAPVCACPGGDEGEATISSTWPAGEEKDNDGDVGEVRWSALLCSIVTSAAKRAS